MLVCGCLCVNRCSWRPEEEVRGPGAAVTDGCEPRWVLELNSGPLLEIVLTAVLSPATAFGFRIPARESQNRP